MILKRIEITLVGPDEYPADEGSLADWEAEEIYARGVLESELEWFLFRARRKLFNEEFDIEISESKESDVPAPSGASDVS